MRRCRFEGGAWIPECWGGVHYGKQGCYCSRATALDALERRVTHIEKMLESETRRMVRAAHKIREECTKLSESHHEKEKV